MKSFLVAILLSVFATASAGTGGLVAGTRGSKIWNYPERYWGTVDDSLARSYSLPAHAAAVWIVTFYGDGGDCYATFPSGGASLAHVSFPGPDYNESYLKEFDKRQMRVWLQIEPGAASVSDLIDVVLSRYQSHACIAGFGIDVEWLDAQSVSGGRRVTDAEASAWEQKVKSYDTSYTLFLKHYTQSRMPLTYRGNILFVDDSQQFTGLTSMVNEFKAWGLSFPSNSVAFQYGYPDDRPWWSQLQKPPVAIGNALLASIPNTAGLFWVDFTVSELFPVAANGVATELQIPESPLLLQNFPNPFNPYTNIRYTVPTAGPGNWGPGSREAVTGVVNSQSTIVSNPGLSSQVWVKLSVYDLLGRQVAVLVDGPQAAGEHTVVFNGSEFPSGSYFCRLQLGSRVATKRLLLLR